MWWPCKGSFSHVLFSLENCYYFIRPKVQEIVGPGCMITPFFGFLLLKTISDWNFDIIKLFEEEHVYSECLQSPTQQVLKRLEGNSFQADFYGLFSQKGWKFIKCDPCLKLEGIWSDQKLSCALVSRNWRQFFRKLSKNFPSASRP